MKRLTLVLCVVLGACVAPAMGYGDGDWDGYGMRWWGGMDDNWASTENWSGGENQWYTGGGAFWDVTPEYTIGAMPVIRADSNTGGNALAIRGGAVVTQVAGKTQWIGGGFPNPAHQFAVFDSGSEFNMSGGLTIVWGDASLGYWPWDTSGTAQAGGSINLSGDAYFALRDQEWNTSNLFINPAGGVITIANAAIFSAPIALQATIDNLIAAGDIVGIGGDLVGVEVIDGENTYYEVSIVPEPASMALLGLGALALRRRKK